MKKRIHLKKKKSFKLFWIIIIVAILLLITSCASKKIKKSTQKFASSEIKKIISKTITESIKESTLEKDIFEIQKDNDEIIAINIDNKTINEEIVNINNIIQKKLDSMENTIVFKMPLFAPTNNIFLVHKGPKIPIKFKMVGNISNNLRTEVKNYGINNALITAYLDIIIECSVILPITYENVKINQTVTLAMKVIQGKIPNYYMPTKN